MTIETTIIALIWIVGACLRIYRQARFYQIEEYMSGRYLRWVVARRDRWLPTRPVAAVLMGIVLGVVLTEAPGSFMLTAISAVSAAVAVWPPNEGEIKKSFKPTARAKRLLGAAFVLSAVMMLALVWLIGQMRLSEIGEVRYVAVMLAGLVVYLGAPLLLVGGNLAMQPVEALFRRRFIQRAEKVLKAVHPTVVGITGSYGKTSTKTYLAHILNGRYKAYPTPKSYNTLMGVCIAINNDIATDHSIEYFICEMGAYIPGEIERICELTHPSISIVVEVGPQHLERFGTLENIAIAKYEIIKALPPDGIGIFNWDNPYVREMYQRGYPQTRLAVSKMVDPANPPADGPRFIASEVSESLEGLAFNVTDTVTGESARFETPLLGGHNVTNVLLATAVAVQEGMKLREIALRVRGLKPAESRLVRQTTPQGITIINDAYSANPVGIAHALRVLSMHQTGRRLLITPGMVELGPLQEQENRKLGEIAAQHASDVILVGAKQTHPIQEGLLSAGFPAERVQVVETLAESVQWYQSNLKAGDTVLFLNDLPDTYSS
ncbi:MAG: UDP-N-acetylmuramoyl-tripeptide--D-alanyl-D-alanine ligase [Anaerolineae bacterium]|nr:UDP-N-acetylmuramoyl-tripeptide--D-alanyl-D-alanine ligase [Anaerolineae bacterium]